MRLAKTPTLQDLAVNPLLLTLIATVHRYRSELPGRRVELFGEICDVFLGKRQQARGLELDLTPAQKVRILRALAYEMMCRQVREIAEVDASETVEQILKLVSPMSEPQNFLRMVEDSSGLLVQKESGIYGFAHLIFQEYLAALHIKEEKLVTELADRVGLTWWHETARLYSALADATPLVEKCLAPERPTVTALILASECEAEALELRGDLHEKLRLLTECAAEDPNLELRKVVAEYMLARRNRYMLRINDDKYIDTSPITHAEYQLFIDEERLHGEVRKPDHWEGVQFQPGTGLTPVVGIRKADAEAFCLWLSARNPGEWKFALPLRADLVFAMADERARQDVYFMTKDTSVPLIKLSAQIIKKRIFEDRRMSENSLLRRSDQWTRACHRLLLFSCWHAAFAKSRSQRSKRFRFAMSILRILTRGIFSSKGYGVPGGIFNRIHMLIVDVDKKKYDNALLQSLAQELTSEFLDRDLKMAFELKTDLTRARDRRFDRELDDILASISKTDWQVARTFDKDVIRKVELALQAALIRSGESSDYTFLFLLVLLNWLCLTEQRIEGSAGTFEGLWLTRVHSTEAEMKAMAADAR